MYYTVYLSIGGDQTERPLKMHFLARACRNIGATQCSALMSYYHNGDFPFKGVHLARCA